MAPVRYKVYHRENEMSLVHKAMTEILRPFLYAGRAKYEVKREENAGESAFHL